MITNWLNKLRKGQMSVKSTSTPTPELTEEQKAVQLLMQAEEQRKQQCLEEVNVVLQKHGFAIGVSHNVNLVRVQNNGQ